jgi:hypothetical protein
MKNARFWMWLNGSPVKLTLKPRQSLCWEHRQSTDEGWSAVACSWFHYVGDGTSDRLPEQSVCRHEYRDGVDCDGRMSSHVETECPLYRLDTHITARPYQEYHDGKLIRYPEWDWLKVSQRDYEAEKAGY